MSVKDFEYIVRTYHRALEAFFTGNCKPIEELFSHTNDVTLAYPFGGISHGWDSVARTVENTASRYKDGTINFENVEILLTPDLALLVDFEHINAKVDGKEGFSKVSHRATSIFRLENGMWKLAHRHADPLVISMRTK